MTRKRRIENRELAQAPAMTLVGNNTGDVADRKNLTVAEATAMGIGGGAGGGEANTGSNVGADGIGVFDAKVGVDLRFRKVRAASSKVTVALNAQQVDVDVAPANFTGIPQAGVTNLVTDLGSKSAVGHGHPSTDITGLAAVATSGSAADLGTGTLLLARLSGITDAQIAAANKSGTAATESMRQLGAGAAHACAGNDARLSDARTPAAHATSHKSGGADAIKLDELAAPTDITTLNASTTAHGLAAKLSGVAGQYQDGLIGAWTTLPAGSSGALAMSQHVLAANFTITAGYSSTISRYLEIGDTFTLEIGDDADLEVT